MNLSRFAASLLLVAPALLMAGTDSKHYVPIADDSYRFTPVTLTRADMSRIHGLDERLAVDDYEPVVDFYVDLLRGS